MAWKVGSTEAPLVRGTSICTRDQSPRPSRVVIDGSPCIGHENQVAASCVIDCTTQLLRLHLESEPPTVL